MFFCPFPALAASDPATFSLNAGIRKGTETVWALSKDYTLESSFSAQSDFYSPGKEIVPDSGMFNFPLAFFCWGCVYILGSASLDRFSLVPKQPGWVYPLNALQQPSLLPVRHEAAAAWAIKDGWLPSKSEKYREFSLFFDRRLPSYISPFYRVNTKRARTHHDASIMHKTSAYIVCS